MIRFGCYLLDSRRRTLEHDGQDVHLTPKAFDLLQLLLDLAPGVVQKTTLHSTLWPNHEVSDANLVGLIKELRRALQDHDRGQRLIRTVHRVGYAFDGPVETADPAACPGTLVFDERNVRLTAGSNLIGRDEASDIRIGNATVSRRHAMISIAQEGAALEDLGSKNGTRVEGRPIERHTLRDGDNIQFGDVVAVYRASTSRSRTATQIDAIV